MTCVACPVRTIISGGSSSRKSEPCAHNGSHVFRCRQRLLSSLAIRLYTWITRGDAENAQVCETRLQWVQLWDQPTAEVQQRDQIMNPWKSGIVFLQPCFQVLFCTLLSVKTDRVVHRVGGLPLPSGDFQVAFGFLNPLLRLRLHTA